MTVSLPKGVDAYVDGTNAHDSAAITKAFADDGSVHDEGKVHRGRAEIAVWARDTVNRYRMTMTPLSSSGEEKVVLKARVEGTFPGSPADLTFTFEIGDDAIKSLKVG